ncbi:MAG: tryptophan/tyrosine permease [Gammaproteobacteria bacterium RIFCSPHIGHO2_12_FULL_41_20]|nr:MAG: tryptophan/tyrosine permease [Gammaproteobacteria bacterium RIFCSPHIGHO2_12_FULL_41_20]
MMNARLLGGVLLIIGTTIGGAMLALPIATSQLGFAYSSLSLFVCWLIMTAGAFLILEVNLWLPRNNNIISMAKATLGKPGQFVAWVTYLLLLYSLLAAYITGGGDFFRNLLTHIGLTVSPFIACVLFTVFLGYIVYQGVRCIDYVNRGLMFAKLGSYLLLVVFIFPYISPSKLIGGELIHITNSITVCIVSFGFATIVPSLRVYFHDDRAMLRKAILIGSFIPLVCYIAWNLTIMGVISREGDNGLIAMLQSGRSTSEFVEQINVILNKRIITDIARFFTSICLATAFLGVSLGLTDFLADGFMVERKGFSNVMIMLVAFVPPLIIALYYPGAFVAALSYAGIYCAILMILLPALMVWRGRYHKHIANGFRVPGGKALLLFLMAVSGIVIVLGLSSV